MAAEEKRKWIIARTSVILIPVILSFLFLFYPFEKIQLDREGITENSTTIKVSEDEIFKPSLKTTLRDILEVPFDLKWYDICFENRDTKLIYENGETDENVNVSLNFNNQTKIYIPHGETRCVTYKFNKEFTYNWGFAYSPDFSKISWKVNPNTPNINIITLHPDVDSYAKPELSGIIAKNVLFLFAWSGLVLLLLEIIDFIRVGRKK